MQNSITVDLKCHGVPRDRCSTCGNTVSVLSWASKCTCTVDWVKRGQQQYVDAVDALPDEQAPLFDA